MLAVTALANVSACVSHPHPSNAATLVWYGGMIPALLALAAGAGHLLLTWEQGLTLKYEEVVSSSKVVVTSIARWMER